MNKLTAHHNAKEFFFTVTSKEKDRVSICMYSTDYTFVKSAAGWDNGPGNRFKAAPGLIEAIILAMGL